MAVGHSMCEVQEHARIALHGAAHIAQQDEGSWLGAMATGRKRDDFAARPQASYQGTPDVDTRSSATNPSTSPALARNPVEPFESKAGARHLLRRELGEVFVSQATEITPGLHYTLVSLLLVLFA